MFRKMLERCSYAFPTSLAMCRAVYLPSLTFFSSSLYCSQSCHPLFHLHWRQINTYFNCLLKSSFSSSSSQLSSHRCVVPPGTSVSSCDQSRESKHVSRYLVGFGVGRGHGAVYVPSTGKSSNSSSSSSMAGPCVETGLEVLEGSASLLCVGCSFAVGAEVSFEDIVRGCGGCERLRRGAVGICEDWWIEEDIF